jgi:hypothetical protein
MKGEVIKMSLDEIVARLRKVKYGDFVLADDHNDLVDAVRTISETLKWETFQSISRLIKYIKCFSFFSDETYSVDNDASEEGKSVYKSVYSERIGDFNTVRIFYRVDLYARLWSTVFGQYSIAYLCLHSSDHPPGEVVNTEPYLLPDSIAYFSVMTDYDTPREKEDWFLSSRRTQPQRVYAVVWVGSYASNANQPFTAYCDRIKTFAILEGVWT